MKSKLFASTLLMVILIFSGQNLFAQNINSKPSPSIYENIYHLPGNIGIGTDNPLKLLHIDNTDIPGIRLSVENQNIWDIDNDNGLLFN